MEHYTPNKIILNTQPGTGPTNIERSYRGIPPSTDGRGNLGGACVHFNGGGAYASHVAKYGSHTECFQMVEPCKRGFKVFVPITTWDRLDIIKEAHKLFQGSDRPPASYKDLYRDWGPVEQFLQTHPNCTQFDLAMYPNHPAHVIQPNAWVAYSGLSCDNKECVLEETTPPKRPRLH